MGFSDDLVLRSSEKPVRWNFTGWQTLSARALPLSIAHVLRDGRLFSTFFNPVGYTVSPQGIGISPFSWRYRCEIFIFIKPDLPFHKESIESWIKLLEDIGKTALLAMLPLFWLNSYSLTERASGVAVLALVAYFVQVYADKLRKYRDSLNRKDTSC
ncbi:Uncharacterised protein [Neisseria gonorrhoeae]|uniref:Uncharacterized protein n=2 Tax=Neisseria gonorrhoeae TaxID=485 RepID=A0A378VYD9_NEIGO|nr:Uncharacterised protein [Neisseria gonorrhoeae]